MNSCQSSLSYFLAGALDAVGKSYLLALLGEEE
jgi:hypothetical protein